MQTNARRVQLSCITMNPWFVFYCNNLTFCVYCVTSNLIFCVFGFLFQDTVFIIKDRILCTVMSFLCKNENTTIKSVYGAKALPSVQFGGFSFQKLICRRKFVRLTVHKQAFLSVNVSEFFVCRKHFC